MIKNYFRIAWRTVLKNKGLFTINIVGLALGIASCLSIALYVVDELSYDRFHKNSDQIVRVVLNAKMGDEIIKEASVMAPVGNTFLNELPGVVDATRIIQVTNRVKAVYNEKTLRKGKMAFVDSNFMEMFTLPLIKGDKNTALSRPNSLILTKEQAEAYFGDGDPLNRTLDLKDIGIYGSEGYLDVSGLYTVTGVIDEIPRNSHFQFDLLASMGSNADAANQSWLNGSYHTYLLLAKGTKISELEAKIPPLSIKYLGPQLQAALGVSYAEFIEKKDNFGLYLQPLSKIHLYSDVSGSLEEDGDINSVYMFTAIAVFMLLIACVNFINLATAGASKRIKEIGMRKVLGSEKRQLIFQFLTESFLATLFAMAIGIILFVVTLPYFNQLANKTFTIGQIATPQFIMALTVLTLVISLLAGGYPAFYMSGFKPLQALRNRFTSDSSKGIRGGLVVFQFAISACLIIGTLVVGQQMDYIQSKDLGYDREGLIVLRDAGLLGSTLHAYKSELEKDSRVLNITNSAFVPAGPSDNNRATLYPGDNESLKLRVKIFNIDEAYIPTLGMKMREGRNFSKEFGDEKNNVIINETAIKAFGLKGNPIGRVLKEVADLEGGRATLTIVGVIKDFNARSLREPIEPLIMKYNPYSGLIIRAKTSDAPGLIAGMEREWESFGVGEPFDYAFLDELYNETYLKEQNMSAILRIFAFLTIFVGCLGLLGLVTFTAQQRIKEIGIRKILGSSVSQIVGMLAKDFLKLILLSMGIAIPVGYYLMNRWLQGFAYRIDIQWWVFAVAAIILVGIAFITIGFRSMKAALANPVESLRSE